MPLEELDFALVSLGGGAGLECPQVSALASLRIGFPRVETELAGAQFSDHDLALQMRMVDGDLPAVAQKMAALDSSTANRRVR